MSNSYYKIKDPSFTGHVYLAINNSKHFQSNIKYLDEIFFFEEGNVEPITLVSIHEVYLERSVGFILRGIFYIEGQLISEITIYCYDSIKYQLLFNILRNKIVEECTAKLIVGGKSNKFEFDVKLKKIENAIILYDASSNKKITVYKNDKDMFFLSGNVLLTSGDDNNYLHYLIFNEENIPIDLSNFKVDIELYNHLNFQLYGSIKNRRFNGEKISLLSDTRSLLVFIGYGLAEFVIKREDLSIISIKDNSKIVFKYTSENNVSYFTFSKITKKESSLTSDQLHKDILSLPIFKNIKMETAKQNNIYLDEQGNPYIFDYNNDKLFFYQSNDYNFAKSFKDTTIKFIEHRNSEAILISLKENIPAVSVHKPSEMKFIVDRNIYSDLLNVQYKANKKSLMKEASLSDLYSSWGRQINDYLMYNFFGQLVILNNGIQEIKNNKNNSINGNNYQLLNFMYYAIRGQKKLLDRVSIGFPSVLYGEESNFLDNQKSVQYERLQKQLIVCSNQVQRYLTEIESSLNALNFAIIPRKKIEEIYEEKPKRNYWGALLLGGLGVLTGGIGLVAAGGLLGLNTYLSNSDTVKINQYLEENDNNKIDFYINKALDSFEHLMQNVLPYYISQVSNAYYSTHRLSGELLLSQDYSADEIAYKKEEMFNRLVKLYVEKRMPLESQSLLTIEDIVKELVRLNNPQKLKITGSTK